MDAAHVTGVNKFSSRTGDLKLKARKPKIRVDVRSEFFWYELNRRVHQHEFNPWNGHMRLYICCCSVVGRRDSKGRIRMYAASTVAQLHKKEAKEDSHLITKGGWK